jgi:hypothetical protein
MFSEQTFKKHKPGIFTVATRRKILFTVTEKKVHFLNVRHGARLAGETESTGK